MKTLNVLVQFQIFMFIWGSGSWGSTWGCINRGSISCQGIRFWKRIRTLEVWISLHIRTWCNEESEFDKSKWSIMSKQTTSKPEFCKKATGKSKPMVKVKGSRIGLLTKLSIRKSILRKFKIQTSWRGWWRKLEV